MDVSTHSRLKAAGNQGIKTGTLRKCFNTQPPEGGWLLRKAQNPTTWSFNTQPPEGGWVGGRLNPCLISVSTHSRLKAAGELFPEVGIALIVSTHSRLKAAGSVQGVGEFIFEFQHTAA